MYKTMIGVITAMLYVITIASCDACVTVNTQNNIYVVDSSGCVN